MKRAFQDLARPAAQNLQEQERESFLRLDKMAKKAQSKVKKGSDDNNADDSQKNRPLLLHERVNDFRRNGIGDHTADDALRDIERRSRQADSPLSRFNQNARNDRGEQKGRW
jgi:hypothetical protein